MCLAIVQVAIDWLTRIEFNESIVYVLPLVLAAMTRNRRLLWGIAVFLIATAFAVYAVQIPAGTFSGSEPLFINRVLSAATILITACLLHAWTLTLDSLDEQGRDLQARNEELDAANRELLERREQINRQNAELECRRHEAEEASTRKSRLLASVSHDIRSPLHALNLTAELIRRTAGEQAMSAQMSELVQLLQTNAGNLADLVSDVLDVAAIESGRIELRESEFSLNGLLAEVCRLSLAPARAKNLELLAEPSTPEIWIRGDRVKLVRVLGNLVSNAIKFTTAGEVRLEACIAADRSVLIRVHDTGAGISPQHIERIFNEFEQVHQTEHDRVKGWGLGLAICRRLVEFMGGTITVESQPRQGTIFSVCLPCSCIVDHRPSGAALDDNEPNVETTSPVAEGGVVRG